MKWNLLSILQLTLCLSVCPIHFLNSCWIDELWSLVRKWNSQSIMLNFWARFARPIHVIYNKIPNPPIHDALCAWCILLIFIKFQYCIFSEYKIYRILNPKHKIFCSLRWLPIHIYEFWLAALAQSQSIHF